MISFAEAAPALSARMGTAWKRRRLRGGFNLIEVTIALAVAVFCLLTIMALIPVGVQLDLSSNQNNGANSILNAVASDLRATSPAVSQGGTAVSQEFGITIPSDGKTSTTNLFFNNQGAATTSLSFNSTYRLTVTFLASGGGRAATQVVLKAIWPATSAVGLGSTELFIALDRN